MASDFLLQPFTQTRFASISPRTPRRFAIAVSRFGFVVGTGGASAPVETIRAWRRAAPGVLLELLGMLETGYQA